jgi:hypothetical protein
MPSTDIYSEMADWRPDLASNRSDLEQPINCDCATPIRDEVSVKRSSNIDTASIALPMGISLEDRAARMNEFWRALVEFQHRDVLVVALCMSE